MALEKTQQEKKTAFTIFEMLVISRSHLTDVNVLLLFMSVTILNMSYHFGKS
jgi:hypothetical protein